MADRPFKALSESELNELDDDGLVGYLVAARDAGEPGEVKRAMQFLVYGRMDLVQTIVADKVPAHAVDRVASDAMIETMSAVFDGVSIGQFVNFLKTVARRKAADHWKSLGRHGHEDMTLDSDDETRRRHEVVDTGEEVDAVPLQAIVDRHLDALSPCHRAVVEVSIFQDLASGDAAAEVNRLFPDLDDPMTSANVDQIKSRFRKTLRDELDHGDTS